MMKHPSVCSSVCRPPLCRVVGLLLWIGLLLAACSGDGYHYPSVRQELLTAYSGMDGTLQRVVTDRGRSYPVAQDRTHTHTAPDSLLRILTNYQVDALSAGDSAVTLYALAQVVAPLPQPLSDYPQGISRHPVDVVSLWMGCGYLNLLLTVREQQGRHRFGYVEQQEPATPDDDGVLRVRLTLHHQVDDAQRQDYAKRVYLSVPLWPYLQDAAVRRLHVQLTLTLYSGEERQYEFQVTGYGLPVGADLCVRPNGLKTNR